MKFDIDGKEIIISELKNPIEFTLKLDKNKNYAVLRIHNGKVELLEDLDDIKNTVTVSTDKFSTYVIINKVTKDTNGAGYPLHYLVGCLALTYIMYKKIKKSL